MTELRAACLVLINGVPGSGKSTLASALAAAHPMALALDVDQLKHALGHWDTDLQSSGLQARRLAIAAITQHLKDGHDVVVGQYLPKRFFRDELQQTAERCGAQFVEFVLDLSAEQVARRLAGRAQAPSRPEHRGNDLFVGPQDVEQLVMLMHQHLVEFPDARVVAADASTASLVAELELLLGWS